MLSPENDDVIWAYKGLRTSPSLNNAQSSQRKSENSVETKRRMCADENPSAPSTLPKKSARSSTFGQPTQGAKRQSSLLQFIDRKIVQQKSVVVEKEVIAIHDGNSVALASSKDANGNASRKCPAYKRVSGKLAATYLRS